ncbi:MAG: hypothetical protein COA42_06095 [Alteromonadaceae bacterium]|nr:MAG: hypothetical protein COA42_06095 [Alteromonadaceae bacterium]
MLNAKLILTFSFAGLLLGCSGDSDNSPAPIPEPENQAMQVEGLWASSIAGNESFEFFPSVFKGDLSAGLKTGRMTALDGSKIPFYWESEGDDTLLLNLVNPECVGLPLNACGDVEGIVTIVASPGLANDRELIIDFDDDADGLGDRNLTQQFRRVNIDVSNLNDGEIFFIEDPYFEVPLEGAVNGSVMSIQLPYTGTSVTVSANIANGAQESLMFDMVDSMPVSSMQAFPVTDGDSQELVVNTWYDHVVLNQSGGDYYALSFSIQREAVLPSDVNADDVDLSGLVVQEERTVILDMISEFIAGDVITASDRYYSFIQLDFNFPRTISNSGNELVFTSNSEGTLFRTDLFEGQFSETRDFTWTQENDGRLVLDFEGVGETNIRFIEPVPGGYRALIQTPRYDGPQYIVHDFIRDADTPIVIGEDIPGRFELINNDGVTKILVNFNADNSITFPSIPNLFGFWFQDTNGDIVSYECVNNSFQIVTIYEDCLGSFDDLSNVFFSHIRRVRFLAKQGDLYTSAYDSIFWGGPFGTFDGQYTSTAWTYRWHRLGD